MWDHSVLELFFLGGLAMWPLLAFSVVGWAVIMERTIVFFLHRGHFTSLTSRLQPLLRRGQIDSALEELKRWPGPLARVAATYLHWHRTNPVQCQEAAERAGSEQIARLETRVHWLGIIGQLAPMLGLLGTVTGLVTAFHRIEIAGGAVQPSDLAAGIWEALITTVFGLVIALPCLGVYSLLDRQLSALTLQMNWLIQRLKEDLTPATVAPAEGK